MSHDADWSDARTVANASGFELRRGATEEVLLAQALGRSLGHEVRALVDLPTFDTVAMDGWAVCGDAPWRVVGTHTAGEPPPSLSTGEAVEVTTGSVLPPGSAGIVRREEGALCDGMLTGAAHADVRPAGEQCRRGDLLLPPGATVTPPTLGLLAAAGHDSVLAVPQPTVSAAIIGNELTTSGVPAAGRVRDAIGPILPGFVAWAGGALRDITWIADERESVRQVLTAETDIVVTSGGTSVGSTDHVHGALAEIGATLVVDGVSVRPGHPMLLARLPGDRWLVGLPGNPLAAAAAVVTLLWPLLDGLLGRDLQPLPQAPLRDPVTSTGRATTLRPATFDAAGLRLCEHSGPAMLRGISGADVLAVLPPGEVRAGTSVPFLLLPPR